MKPFEFSLASSN